MKFITKVCSHIRYNKKNSVLNWIDRYSEKRICALFRIILNSTQIWLKTNRFIFCKMCYTQICLYTNISFKISKFIRKNNFLFWKQSSCPALKYTYTILPFSKNTKKKPPNKQWVKIRYKSNKTKQIHFQLVYLMDDVLI